MDPFSGHIKTKLHNDLQVLQDTIVPLQDTTVQNNFVQDTLLTPSDSISEVNSVEQPSQEAVDESVIIPVTAPVARPQTLSIPDSSFNNTRYQYDGNDLSDDNYLNFLRKSEDQFFYVMDSARLVYSNTPHQSYKAETQVNQELLSSTKAEQLIKPDWLIGIIIGCLVLFAWLKLFYNKFIDQTFISLWNFQLSENFLRDQSIFSRRVSMLLNLNFIVTTGLFFYLIAVFFELNPWSLTPFKVFLISTGTIALLLAARYIVSHITGTVFNYHKLFKDYLNQILIIYKIAGIVLIPIIMAIAYLPDNLRIYLIITGLILLAAGVLFRFVKGIQLIFNKDVSIFYLILYLCTLEFLPALVIYKFFSSLV